VRIQAASATDRGLRRPENEDAHVAESELGIFCVADGMGGHAAGEVASRLAVEAFSREMERLADASAPDGPLEAKLRRAATAANRAILDAARADPATEGMGTTLTAVALTPERDAFAGIHIGDSRAYLFREGTLRQLTTDHTWVQQQVDAGALTPLQARHHPFASVLTRALGLSDDPEFETFGGDLRPGDMLLLCSDGLTGMVEDDELAFILAGESSLDARVQALIDAANRNGGFDNITVILIQAAE
jgi:serine/threonine protein phosphatase PrpC